MEIANGWYVLKTFINRKPIQNKAVMKFAAAIYTLYNNYAE